MGSLGWNAVRRTKALAIVAALVGVGLLAGCDERVYVDRDPTVRIARGMTWAWRPAPQNGPQGKVISRDVIRPDRPRPTNDPDNEFVRGRVKDAIERQLTEKGLVQVDNPATADFLVDYHVAVQQRRERVATPVNRPMLVCGYYGCWNSYGWGYWGPPEVVVHTVRYQEGTLVVNLVEQRTSKLAFRAVGQKEVDRDSTTYQSINSGVKRVLRDLKPSK